MFDASDNRGLQLGAGEQRRIALVRADGQRVERERLLAFNQLAADWLVAEQMNDQIEAAIVVQRQRPRGGEFAPTTGAQSSKPVASTA